MKEGIRKQQLLFQDRVLGLGFRTIKEWQRKQKLLLEDWGLLKLQFSGLRFRKYGQSKKTSLFRG